MVIAPSFADIFYNNALKNGIVPIKMEESQINEWMQKAKDTIFVLWVDLKHQQITDDEGKVIDFNIPEYHKEKLLNGWDDIALTLLQEDKILEYENSRN